MWEVPFTRVSHPFSRAGSRELCPYGRKQVEKFFEPSVNAIVEGINNVVAGVDPSGVVGIGLI